ncbi:hypothetical protein Tco_1201876 [Tanacetum coccineum]
MSASRQGMSSEEMKKVVAQRVANVIEAIAIYKSKIRMAHDLINQAIREVATVGKNVSNKRKWGSDHGTDIAKISRKWSKPDNHEHGNGIECAKAGECYQAKAKVSDKLLVICERCKEDVIGHISKVLKILNSAKIASVDPFQLRMKAFPLSLLKDAKNWWMNEGDGNISTWEVLAKKFYPISCASNYDKMCDDDEEGRDPLEFIPWRNSKFKDHKKVDETTKRALLYTWIEIGNEEGLLKDKVSSDEEWEEHEYENPPSDSFPKPYVGSLFLNETLIYCQLCGI